MSHSSQTTRSMTPYLTTKPTGTSSNELQVFNQLLDIHQRSFARVLFPSISKDLILFISPPKLAGMCTASVVTESCFDQPRQDECLQVHTIRNPFCNQNSASAADAQYIHACFLCFCEASNTHMIPSLSSSCITPSRIGWPMPFPKSDGPTRRTSTPGTAAIAST